jgi:hypothetical protein
MYFCQRARAAPIAPVSLRVFLASGPSEPSFASQILVLRSKNIYRTRCRQGQAKIGPNCRRTLCHRTIVYAPIWAYLTLGTHTPI